MLCVTLSCHFKSQSLHLLLGTASLLQQVFILGLGCLAFLVTCSAVSQLSCMTDCIHHCMLHTCIVYCIHHKCNGVQAWMVCWTKGNLNRHTQGMLNITAAAVQLSTHNLCELVPSNVLATAAAGTLRGCHPGSSCTEGITIYESVSINWLNKAKKKGNTFHTMMEVSSYKHRFLQSREEMGKRPKDSLQPRVGQEWDV